MEAYERDPVFRKMTYEKQVLFRQAMVMARLGRDPEFLAMAPDRRQVMVQALSAAQAAVAPALYSYDASRVTDADRMAYDAGTLDADPDGAYKKGIIAGERLAMPGPADAATESQAARWIVANRVGTESLLARVALGAKDAIEVLFGADDGLFDDLRFHTQDYQKMSTWMLQNMSRKRRESTAAIAGAMGFGVNMIETVALNILTVGTMGSPGLFTKGLWNAVGVARTGATTARGMAMATTVLPAAAEALGSGTVDVLRNLPQLVEAGYVQGPKTFFEGLAGTFGQGVAFDFVFNTAKDLYKFLLKPTAKALKGLDLTDAATLQPFLDAHGNFEPAKFGAYLSETLNGRVAKEVYDQLPDEASKAQFSELAHFMKTNADVPNLDLRTAQGFRVMAKAMGYDAALDEATGKVRLKGDLISGPVALEFGSRSEAVSWIMDQSQGMGTGVFTEANAALAGGSMGRLVLGTKTEATLKDLNAKQVATLLAPNFRGESDPETMVAAVKRLVAINKKNLLGVKVVPEADYWRLIDEKGSKGLGYRQIDPFLVPASFKRPYTFRQFADNLSQRVGVAPETLMPSGSLGVESLQAAVAKFAPGYELQQAGSRYLLKGPQGVVRQFSELTEANKFVAATAIKAGVMSEDDIIAQVQRYTGYVLSKDKDPLGVVATRWVLRDRGSGKIVQQADDIMEILDGPMGFAPKLPELLAPELVVTKGGKLIVNQTVAYGPVTSLRKMLDDYGSPDDLAHKGHEVVHTFADGGTLKYKAGTGSYALEVPTYGLRKEFSSAKEAKDFVGRLAGDFGTLRHEAEAKGFHLVALPDGTVGFHDGVTMRRARTVEEARDIMASSPDPEAHKNLFQFVDPEIEASITAKAAERIRNADAMDFEDMSGAIGINEMRIRANAGTFWKPALSSLEEMAEQYGKPEIVENAREFLLLKRYVGTETYKVSKVIRRMLSDNGKLFKRSEMDLLGKLLQYREDMWDSAARQLMENPGFVLTEGHKRALRQSREYLRHMGDYFGIDPLRFLEQYSPHIKKVLAENGGVAEMLTKMNRGQVLEALFGKQWEQIPEVKFLSKNARLDAFLQANNQSNLMNTLLWYSEHGLREKYLGAKIDQMRVHLDDLRASQANPVYLGRLASFYAAATGGDSDFAAAAIADASIKASKKTVEILESMKAMLPKGSPWARRLSEIAESTTTTNYLDKMSQTMSYATLGFRPFRAMSNMVQYTNVWSIYGHYANEAVAAVDEAGDAYVRQLFSKGIINEKIFAASGADLGSKLQSVLDKSLSWQQNSEYLTRAWTAKAVELAFDENFEKLSKGLFGDGFPALQRFMKLTQLDLLADPDQVRITQLLQAGKPEAARDLAQTSMIRVLMFDYSKENYPMAFKGTMGRVFGKFGVFPVGQIDLYRRILERSDWTTRVLRGLRLMGSSLAVYEGFRQVGIDYSGFLFYDPFSFAGGPLYQAAQDLLRARDTGPEGAFARSNLSRNFLPWHKGKPNVPRLLVPGALEMNALGKAITTMDQKGFSWEAFLDAISAPRDSDWMGPGRWYW